ncbi:hypothetical protein ACIPY2_10150 [Paenarthrobacter sp. NPDC089675]|uniref:hypothetical protein n=1 Tax=Paenarthrobacter sp. NPDC089675 TaxID=3364376 RepID=UPI0037FB714E
MTNNNGAPQPPYNPDGVPQPRYNTDQGQYRQYQSDQTQPLYQPEAQQQPGYPGTQQPGYPGTAQPGYPGTQQPGYSGAPQPGGPNQNPGDHNKKALFLILGGIAVVVVIALVVVFAWLIPSATKPVAVETPTPTGEASGQASDAAIDPSEQPSADATGSGDMPAGAIPLPAGWDQLAGPSNVPADGDPLFSKWVTGESSFQYLAEWTHDESFGITKDPSTGEEIQKRAQGTAETDGDGIALAYAFFAESEEGKFGKEPADVKKAIEDIEARYRGMTATELPQNLVGHKCASDFKTSMPEIREFRRGAAVVVGFTCTNARGEQIQAVNLFSVTPWGTPQMLGVSGHKEYWDAHPGLFQQLANSYRINKWKMS